jgi:hypothetical protein
MRVAGLLMVLLALLAGSQFSDHLFAVAAESPLFVVGLGAFLDSFGRRISWPLGAVLALVWCSIAFSFLFVFTGAAGPPVFVPILSVLLSLVGLVIVPLAHQTRQ